MTTWSYRVVKKTSGCEEFYGVHEVYYTEDGKPEMVTVEAVGPVGDTVKELRQELAYMLRALRMPILDYEDIP